MRLSMLSLIPAITACPRAMLIPNRSQKRMAVLTASNSEFREKTRLVIRDSVLWATVWPRVIGFSDPMPAVPQVAFPGQILILAALGERGAGGFSITIDSIVDTPIAVMAYVHSISPGLGCVVTLGFTQPIQIVAIPTTEKPISLHEHDERAPPCKSVR